MIDENGQPRISLATENGVTSLRMEGGERGLSTLVLVGREQITSLQPGRLRVSQKDKMLYELLERIAHARDQGRDVTELEGKLNERLEKESGVVIGLTDIQGGVINIHNPNGDNVVSMQANKSNAGAVYLHDATGRITEALPRRSQ